MSREDLIAVRKKDTYWGGFDSDQMVTDHDEFAIAISERGSFTDTLQAVILPMCEVI